MSGTRRGGRARLGVPAVLALSACLTAACGTRIDHAAVVAANGGQGQQVVSGGVAQGAGPAAADVAGSGPVAQTGSTGSAVGTGSSGAATSAGSTTGASSTGGTTT